MNSSTRDLVVGWRIVTEREEHPATGCASPLFARHSAKCARVCLDSRRCFPAPMNKCLLSFSACALVAAAALAQQPAPSAPVAKPAATPPPRNLPGATEKQILE